MAAIFTSSNIKPMLERYNRTYNNQKYYSTLQGALGSAQDIAEKSLDTEYSKQINEAYVSSMQNKNAVAGEGFTQGMKSAYEQGIMSELNSAFDQYVAALQSDKSSVASNTADEVLGVQAGLDKQAQNMADYGNAHIDYIKALYEKAQSGELRNNPFENVTFARYLTDDMLGGELKSTAELESMMYDAEGNLSAQGKDILLQLENDLAQTGDYSFAEYLRENNEDLYNWANEVSIGDSQNVNPAGSPTNRASFLANVVGDTSDTYSFFARGNKLGWGDANRFFGDIIAQSGIDDVKFDDPESVSTALNNIADEMGKYGINVYDIKGYNEIVKSIEDLEKNVITDADIEAKVKSHGWRVRTPAIRNSAKKELEKERGTAKENANKLSNKIAELSKLILDTYTKKS